MTLTPEQIEEIEKRHARRPFETVGDYMKVLGENYYDIAALLADNKELREQLTALTPTSPSPDRLTEEEASEIALLKEQVNEIEARVKPTIGPTFGSDGQGGIRETREGRIQSTDFYTLLGLATAGVLNREKRLTTPQAPSVPTRERMMQAVIPALRRGMTDELHDAANCRSWKEDMILTACRAMKYQNPEDAANKTAEIVAGYVIDAFVALFTPSPSPEQRGETPNIYTPGHDPFAEIDKVINKAQGWADKDLEVTPDGY